MREQTTARDSLEVQQQSYLLNNNIYRGQSKAAMQQLYKQQLDSLMQSKAKQREEEKNRQLIEREEFNERARQGKESQRLKELSYKNYYSMLMSNQEHHQKAYVSPYQQRDDMKESHIKVGVEGNQKKYEEIQLQLRRRESEKKSKYKHDLLEQIEAKKKRDGNVKIEVARQNMAIEGYARQSRDLMAYERERRKEDMVKYKQDLDQLREEKKHVRNKTSSESTIQAEVHDVLTNPIPYNIQNPYILREMNARLSSQAASARINKRNFSVPLECNGKTGDY